MSIPGPALSVYSPLSNCGAPIQYSTTSSPLITSPAASGSVFPCSLLKHSASLSISLLSKSTNFIKTLALRCGLVAAHAGCAFAAISTAQFISSTVANDTFACTSPVAGLNTSEVLSDFPDTISPSI